MNSLAFPALLLFFAFFTLGLKLRSQTMRIRQLEDQLVWERTHNSSRQSNVGMVYREGFYPHPERARTTRSPYRSAPNSPNPNLPGRQSSILRPTQVI